MTPDDTRVILSYRPLGEDGEAKELPFSILVISDLSPTLAPKPIVDRVPPKVNRHNLEETRKRWGGDEQTDGAWRRVRWLLDRIEPRSNVQVCLLPTSKDDLVMDFEDVNDVSESGLFKLAVPDTPSTIHWCDPQPLYNLIVADFELSPRPMDVALAGHLAKVAAACHAPVLAAASSQFFGVDDPALIAQGDDFGGLFDAPQYNKWSQFRDSRAAQHIALLLPQLRLFDDSEGWDNPAFALASCAARSFVRDGWSGNVAGRQGGLVPPKPQASHAEAATALSTDQCRDLARHGFIAVSVLDDHWCFEHTPTAYRQSGNDDAGQPLLMSQLPYRFIASRFVHLARSWCGVLLWDCDDQNTMTTVLRSRLGELTCDEPTASLSAEARSRTPLRDLRVEVRDASEYWWQIKLALRPHVGRERRGHEAWLEVSFAYRKPFLKGRTIDDPSTLCT